MKILIFAMIGLCLSQGQPNACDPAGQANDGCASAGFCCVQNPLLGGTFGGIGLTGDCNACPGKKYTIACHLGSNKDCPPVKGLQCCMASVNGLPKQTAPGLGWCGDCSAPKPPPPPPPSPGPKTCNPACPQGKSCVNGNCLSLGCLANGCPPGQTCSLNTGKCSGGTSLPPGPAPESACQKDFKNCPNFFNCKSDADCPAKDWTCAPDVKSCVLKTEFTALQSYIHAGHKDPFNPTATQKRSFLPGNQTEALHKRGSNFWSGSHAESFVLSVFAQYAYQDSKKLLGKDQGLCSDYKILDTFTSGIFGLECIIYNNDKGYYILAFKGTNSIAETIIDLDAAPRHFADVSKDIKSEIHGGFYSAYNTLRQKFIKVLDPLHKSGALKKFSVTGHSLGAAMAQIATLDLTYRGYIIEFNYNYGTPRVGNADYQKEYDQSTPKVQKAFFSLSYWYSDVIPHLPATWWPFSDAGKLVFYADPPNFFFVECKPDNFFGDGCKADALHNSDRYASNMKRLAGGAACYDLPQPQGPPPPPVPGPGHPPTPVPGPVPGGIKCDWKKN